jgi:hypothetical protein
MPGTAMLGVALVLVVALVVRVSHVPPAGSRHSHARTSSAPHAIAA